MLLQNAGNSKLSIANQIYVNQGSKIRDDFREIATSKFMSGIESLNFANAPASAKHINNFVESKTNGKIRNLIAEDAILPGTRAMLINAIYFKGTWEIPFDKANTLKGDFFTVNNGINSAEFMYNEARYSYGALNDLPATALAMKYANSSFSFVILLPNSRTGLAQLETQLKNYNLEKLNNQMHKQTVEVKIPKFKTEFSIILNNALKKVRWTIFFSNFLYGFVMNFKTVSFQMGITEMFSAAADITGLLESNENLHVSSVIHKAFIEVNEEGTEAAAATGKFHLET